MSDIGGLSSQLANTHAAQAKANVRPEPPPPQTVQNAVAQTLNTPQTAVNQSPKSGESGWRKETNPDDRGPGAEAGEPPSREQLEALIEQLNRRLEHHHQPVRFEVDDQETELRTRVVDHQTRQTIRWMSIPDTLAFARTFAEQDLRQSRGAVGGYASEGQRRGVEGGLLRVTA